MEPIEDVEGWEKHMGLMQEIQEAINRASRESDSNTPDFVLAEYLMNCLNAYEVAVNRRENLKGKES